MDGMQTPFERESLRDRYRRVHLAGDQQTPFAVTRFEEPRSAPRYGRPGLVERLISKVFGS